MNYSKLFLLVIWNINNIYSYVLREYVRTYLHGLLLVGSYWHQTIHITYVKTNDQMPPKYINLYDWTTWCFYKLDSKIFNQSEWKYQLIGYCIAFIQNRRISWDLPSLYLYTSIGWVHICIPLLSFYLYWVGSYWGLPSLSLFTSIRWVHIGAYSPSIFIPLS